MYRITVIDNNGEHTLDMISPSFPYNFEANDIAELANRSSSWSYTIQIPRTPNNEQILGHAGAPFINSNMPYRRLQCNVYSEGLRIIQNGVLIIDKTHTDRYDIQILSGIADIFEQMKDIDYKVASNNNTARRPLSTMPDTGTLYAYAGGTVVSDDHVLIQNRKAIDLLEYAMPFMRIGDPSASAGAAGYGCLSKILNRLGYTLQTDTPTETMKNMFFSMATRKALTTQQTIYQGSETTIPSSPDFSFTVTNACRTTLNQLRMTFRIMPASYHLYEGGATAKSVLSSYLAAGGTFTIYYGKEVGAMTSITYNYQRWRDEGEPTPIVITVDIPNGENEQTFHTYMTYNGSLQFTVTVRGMQVQITLPWSAGSSSDTAGKHTIQLSVDSPDTGVVQPNQNIHLQYNAGFNNEQELFKAICQIFGWTLQVDPNTKVVKAYTFNYIIGRKAAAVDWTNKMAMNEEREVSYDFGKYAKTNYIALAENKITGYTDRAVFTIPNERLADEATLASIKAASGKNNIVEQWTKKEDGTYEWKDGGSPHIITLNDARTTINHYTAADIMANYQGIIDTVQQVKVLKAKFILTTIDILTFSPYTPVFLKQYGHYFYVNKISQWETGKLCEVELIQLAEGD